MTNVILKSDLDSTWLPKGGVAGALCRQAGLKRLLVCGLFFFAGWAPVAQAQFANFVYRDGDHFCLVPVPPACPAASVFRFISVATAAPFADQSDGTPRLLTSTYGSPETRSEIGDLMKTVATIGGAATGGQTVAAGGAFDLRAVDTPPFANMAINHILFVTNTPSCYGDANTGGTPLCPVGPDQWKGGANAPYDDIAFQSIDKMLDSAMHNNVFVKIAFNQQSVSHLAALRGKNMAE